LENEPSMSKDKKPLQENEMPPDVVLEPEYAVGTGLITQDEFSAIKNEYFAQSELSAGLIVPLILLAFAGSHSHWSLGWQRIVVALIVGVVSFLLYLVAVERRFQYRFELKILILGRWDKAKAAAKPDTPKPDITQTKQTVQEQLNVSVDLKPLTLDFRTGTTNVTPAPPAPLPPNPSGGSGKS